MCTYNSHQKYDPTFLGNTKNAQSKSIQKMSPIHVLPSYCNMFSDTKTRNYIFSQRNPLPIDPNICYTKASHNIPLDKNLFTINQHSCMRKSCSQTFIFTPKNNSPIDRKMKHNVKCQTKFRENDCQTDTWQPEAKLSTRAKSMPEILYVKCENYPGMREVKKIERDRVRCEWENKLAEMSFGAIKTNKRIEQLKMFMLEEMLLHEKEFNEDQEQKMNYVYEALKNRDEENKKIFHECIERILKNYEEVKSRKSEKLMKKHERRLKAFMRRKSSSMANDKIFIKNFNSSRDIKMNIPFTDIDEFSRKKYRKNLATPRKSQLKLISIKEIEFEKITRNQKAKKSLPKCLKIKQDFIESDEERNIDDKEEEAYQNHVLIQKTIKGVNVQNRILKDLISTMFMTNCYQKMFPLRCLSDLLPLKHDEKQQVEEIIVKNKEKSIETLIIDKEKNFETENVLKKHLNETVAKIIDDSCQLVHDEWNKKLLQLAKQERERRKILAEIEEIQQKFKNARNEIIKSKINEMYDEVATDLMDKIIPVVIEMIAEKDARKFVLEMADEVSRRAFTNDSSTVDEILNEILLPLIISKLLSDNEHLVALLGSNDAFEDFLKQNFSQ